MHTTATLALLHMYNALQTGRRINGYRSECMMASQPAVSGSVINHGDGGGGRGSPRVGRARAHRSTGLHRSQVLDPDVVDHGRSTMHKTPPHAGRALLGTLLYNHSLRFDLEIQ